MPGQRHDQPVGRVLEHLAGFAARGVGIPSPALLDMAALKHMEIEHIPQPRVQNKCI